jgi:hypothetical protein
MFAGRQQQVPGLFAEEGDGQRCTGRRAAHGPGGAVEAGGHVDGHDGDAALVHCRNQFGGRPFDVAIEAGPEQRVHDEGCAADRVGARRLDLARPLAGVDGGIALEFPGVAEQGQAHRPALLAQEPRHHEAIAAIVARAAQHQRVALSVAGLDCFGDRAARVLHQGERRHAGLDRKCVGAGHFGGRQQDVVCGDGHGASLTARHANKKAAPKDGLCSVSATLSGGVPRGPRRRPRQ